MHAFLDFEASSLAKLGYPIEVAWVFEDGRSESHLIRPLPAWTDWDERAAAIHGISQALLIAEGEAAEVVARRVLDTLSDHTVYASSPSWDGKWLSVLLRAGGLPRHALRLNDTDEAQYEAAAEILAASVAADELDGSVKAVIASVRAGADSQPIAHRALADAMHERHIWLDIREAARQKAEHVIAKSGKAS